MKRVPCVSSPIATLANRVAPRPLLSHSLLGRALLSRVVLSHALLLACLASCSGPEPHGTSTSSGDGASTTAPGTTAAPAPEGAANEGSEPQDNALDAPGNTPPSSPPPGEAPPPSEAPTPSEGPSPSTPLAPPGKPAPSTPADNEGAAPSDVDMGAAAGSASENGAGVPLTCNAAGAASAATPGIWVVGDSTASLYDTTLYPRMGWAQPLQTYYAPACATVNDRALSGRSSKSFVDEGAWAPVRDALRAGDFVLIQFGHNDEKAEDPLRFTDPATTFRDYLSIYIDDTLAHGATPVLLTPIQRNNWDGTALRQTHGAYPDAIRQLAEARNVALVDATALTTEYFERIGTAATTELFLNLAVGQFPNYPDGNTDNTHLREEGAHAVARLILAELARQGSPLGRLVLNVPVAP